MMVTLSVIGGGLSALVSSMLALLAIRSEDAVADLTERLRHPFVWAVKHPLQAVRRLR